MAGLASGLRNDAADDALVMRQRFRLADLRCEDYAFVLAARVLGLLEAAEASGGLAQGGEKAWAPPVGALVLCARHLGLSGWRPSECMALDEELTNWQKLGLVTQRVRPRPSHFAHPNVCCAAHTRPPPACRTTRCASRRACSGASA